jgi:signal transduction histidine kinase
MRQNIPRMTRKQSKILFLFLFASMLFFCINHIRRVLQSGNDEYGVLKRLGQTAAGVMHYDDLIHLNAMPEDTLKVQYAVIKQLLVDIKNINPTACFAHIYMIRDGKAFFVADSEPKNSTKYSPAGKEFIEATDLDKGMMDVGSKATIEFSRDRWGDWVSILVPLKHPKTGKNMAVFGMDFDARALKAEHLKNLLMELLLVFLSIVSLVLFFKVLADSFKLKDEFELLKKTEQELLVAKERSEESDRLKTSFLKNISHEIRTPMNTILGFANLLKEQDLSAEYKELFLNNMVKSGERMLNTIYDIIELSRIQSGQVRPFYIRTIIQEHIDAIQDQFFPIAKEKNLECSCDIAPDDKELVFYTDRDILNSVFQKLLWNAFKFTSEGFVKVGYIMQDTMLCFYVKDSGVGVNEEQKSFIFKYFRQGNESLTRNFEGTGTGLAIAKAHVEMLGGKIWLESEPCVGSTFYFTIPFYKHDPNLTI